MPDSVASEHADDVATAVVQYLSDYSCEPGTEKLHMRALVARALSGCGYRDSGNRLLLEKSRVTRYSSWAVVGDAPVVALDLARLFDADTAGLELMIQHAVGRVLRSIEHAWDASSGRGFLGLRNAKVVASRTLRRPADDRRARVLASELRDYCESALQFAATRRAWEYTPGILELDWVSRK
jgi:hypothetical protein